MKTRKNVEVITQDQINKAFNQGCDARFVGEPITWCRYDEGELRKYWKLGWGDMDRNWGKGSKKYVKSLAKICFDQ